MGARALDLARQNAPWRRDISWPVVAIEGLVVAAIGLYMLIDAKGARDVTRQLIAVILLAHSVLQIVGAFRVPPSPQMRFTLVRAGVGLTVGAIVTLAPFNDYLTDSAARWILGFGLLGYSLITLASLVAGRDEGTLRLGAVIPAALTLLVGILLLTGSEDSTSRTTFLGVIALVAGAGLLAYAFILRRSATAPATSSSG